MTTRALCIVLLCGLPAALAGQPVFRGTDILPPEEFAARRATLMARIGDGVVVIQGATERGGEEPFRQNNQFFYLTGLVEPRAIAVIDGASKRTSVFVLPRNERRELRTIYTPFREEVLGSQSSGDPTRLARNNREDPWDGRASREEAFRQRLQAAAPGATLQDLDALRDARPGMREYELQAVAEFVFKKHGAYGPSYFALVATGRNTFYTHYHTNTAVLQDGDLVQFDYAPDHKYYQSDVTRVFPANGTFTPRQREFYTVYLRLYQALMTSITVHITPGASWRVTAAAPPRAAWATWWVSRCTTWAACRQTRLSPGASSPSSRRCRSMTSAWASGWRT